MLTQAEIDTAERKLAGIPEYSWLTASRNEWWTVSEIAEHLRVGNKTVLAWCAGIAGATKLSQQAGWRIPRSGLLVYLARLAEGENMIAFDQMEARLARLENIARSMTEKFSYSVDGRLWCLYCGRAFVGGKWAHQPGCLVLQAEQALLVEPETEFPRNPADVPPDVQIALATALITVVKHDRIPNEAETELAQILRQSGYPEGFIRGAKDRFWEVLNENQRWGDINRVRALFGLSDNTIEQLAREDASFKRVRDGTIEYDLNKIPNHPKVRAFMEKQGGRATNISYENILKSETS